VLSLGDQAFDQHTSKTMADQEYCFLTFANLPPRAEYTQ
jgi:hypothetical protein